MLARSGGEGRKSGRVWKNSSKTILRQNRGSAGTVVDSYGFDLPQGHQTDEKDAADPMTASDHGSRNDLRARDPLKFDGGNQPTSTLPCCS